MTVLTLREEESLEVPPDGGKFSAVGLVEPKILVVDDEPTVQGFVVRVLTRKGYQCLTAGDSAEAIAVATTENPVLTITDIRMPGSDGTWLLKQLKERCPDMAIIMLTAVAEAQTAVDCLKAGADDFLVKPINVEDLVLSADRALARASAMRESGPYERLIRRKVEERTERLEEAIAHLDTKYRGALCALSYAHGLAERDSRSRASDQREPEPEPDPGSKSDSDTRDSSSMPETTSPDGLEVLARQSVLLAGRLLGEGVAWPEMATRLAEATVSSELMPFFGVYGPGSKEQDLHTVAESGPAPTGGSEIARQVLSNRRLDVIDVGGTAIVTVPLECRGRVEAVMQLTGRGGEDRTVRLSTFAERMALFLTTALTREAALRGREPADR
jgi:DNA-binding response OmpR family regulator